MCSTVRPTRIYINDLDYRAQSSTPLRFGQLPPLYGVSSPKNGMPPNIPSHTPLPPGSPPPPRPPRLEHPPRPPRLNLSSRPPGPSPSSRPPGPSSSPGLSHSPRPPISSPSSQPPVLRPPPQTPIFSHSPRPPVPSPRPIDRSSRNEPLHTLILICWLVIWIMFVLFINKRGK